MARPRKNPVQPLRKTHVKKDDMVVLLSGVDKGKSGRILSVDRKKNRVLVEGVNVRQQTMRRTPSNPQGGLAEKECPVHISNVMLESMFREREAKRAKPVSEAPAGDPVGVSAAEQTDNQEKGES